MTQASSVFPGIAVSAAGSTGPAVGSTSGPPDTTLNGAIKYFIPLDDSFVGTYGVGPLCSGTGAGTCSDSGDGTGYDTASALAMNIFFNLTGEPESADATLSFIFDDLDLTPVNDPDHFKESISLSYWNWNGASFDANPVALTSVIKDVSDLSGIDVDPVDDNIITWEANLITLDLSLAALNALNASSQSVGGYWIQLGFGSDYIDGKHPTNTPEYLAVSLELTPVPVPAAFWLFGTALIGFVGISRRTRVS